MRAKYIHNPDERRDNTLKLRCTENKPAPCWQTPLFSFQGNETF